MTCNEARAIITQDRELDIDEPTREQLDAHVAGCAECHRLQRRISRVVALLSDHYLDEEHDVLQERPRAFPVRALKYALIGAASAVLIGWSGCEIGVRAKFSEASASPPPNAVRGLENTGFESGGRYWLSPISGQLVEGGEEGWFSPRGGLPNYVAIDDSVSHSGGRSLRLLLRNYGGEVHRVLDIPLPAGSLVTMGAWILMKSPGSTDNKVLSLGVSVEDEHGSGLGSTSSEFLTASPVWQYHQLTYMVSKDAARLRLVITTGSGRGQYFRNDRPVWVDDVSLGVTVNLASHTRREGDSLLVTVSMPTGYREDQIADGSVVFETYDDLAPPVTGTLVSKSETAGSRTITYRFTSPEVVRTLQGKNPDTGKPMTGAVALDFVVGGHTVKAQGNIHSDDIVDLRETE